MLKGGSYKSLGKFDKPKEALQALRASEGKWGKLLNCDTGKSNGWIRDGDVKNLRD
jgi:hypothetical protein